MSCNNRSPYSHPSCTSASDACSGAMSSKSNTCRRSSRLETAFYLYMRELFSPRSNTSRVNPRTEAHIKQTELMAALKHSGINNKQLAYKMLLNIKQFVICYDLLRHNLTSSGDEFSNLLQAVIPGLTQCAANILKVVNRSKTWGMDYDTDVHSRAIILPLLCNKQ